jgi:hypothetical protein
MQYRGIAPEELATWFQPRQALKLVQTAYPDIKMAAKVILERLRGGLLKSGAKTSSWEHENFLPTAPCVVPTEYWSRLADTSADWWDTGNIRIKVYIQSRTSSVTGRYFGIRFEPKGIQEIIAEAPPQLARKEGSGSEAEMKSAFPEIGSAKPGSVTPLAPSADSQSSKANTPNKGGAPRKAFWDDLLIAMFLKIWSDNWAPKTQAEIQRAMLDWASDHDHQLSETSVRETAKKLFIALRR